MLMLLFSSIMLATAQQNIMPPHINVSGMGEIRLAPDEVILNFGVEMRDKNLEQARKQVDSKAAAVLKYLKRQGVEERHIQTSYVSVHPVYPGGDFGSANPEYYMAQKSMTVIVKKLAKYDELVSGLYKVGVNRLDGVSFRVADLEKHKAEAQKRAITNAKEKAMALSAELGSKIGRVYAINEGSPQNGPGPMYGKAAMMEASMSRDSEGPSIAGGEVIVTSSVQVTFLLD